MKKKTFWLAVFTPIVVVATAISVILPITLISKQNEEPAVQEANNPTTVIVNAKKVPIHTSLQHSYLTDSIDSIHKYASGKQELSTPLTSELSWEGGNAPYQVFLSEQKDFSDSTIHTVDEQKIAFTNLKINSKYFYKIVSGSDKIKGGLFLTENEKVRNLYVSGVSNARDLGGYDVDEKLTNQGIIYRMGRLNENSETHPVDKITPEGKETMINDLKIKSEIDLRVVSNNEVGGLTEGIGVLGVTVKYYQCPMDYNNLESNDNLDSLRKVFQILGDKSNYPTFFHCSVGTDRTGYIAWLINAVLGVSKDYLWRDYLFSNFGNIGDGRSQSNISSGYVSTIDNTEGQTLKEKTENYLLNKGVKQSEINTLREMMLN